MNRPLLALAGLMVAGGAAGGALLIASSGGEEEVVQVQESASATPDANIPDRSPTPEPTPSACEPNRTAPVGAKIWRWGDVTVIIPEDSGIRVLGDFGAEAKPIMAVYPEEDNDARTIIDAQTGAVLSDQPQGDKETAIQAALGTISVCPLDPSTAPWPYTGEPHTAARTTLGNVSYLEPDPATGIQVLGATSSSGGQFLAAHSSRSSLYIDLETGNVIDPVNIAPDEKVAFDEWLSSVVVVKP